MSSAKLQWHQEFVSKAVVGEERTEYHVIPMPADTGGAIVFQVVVRDQEGKAKPLGLPCDKIEEAFGRCDEDVDRRRGEYHDIERSRIERPGFSGTAGSG